MIPLISLPTNIPEAVSTGYQRQNTLAYAVYTGHISMGFANMENGSAPSVREGSIVEVNGNVYKATAQENITGTLLEGAVNYIYAMPQTNGCTFIYRTLTPGWSTLKGGFYYDATSPGYGRAVLKFFYYNGIYANKVILKNLFDLYTNNPIYVIPESGGYLLASGAVNTEITRTLDVGFYRVELKGGTGGRGGGTGGGVTEGSDSAEVKESFEVKRSFVCVYSTGGNGNPGLDGRASADGGQSGGLSYCNSPGGLKYALGGTGGKGANNSAAGGAGGIATLQGGDGLRGETGAKGNDGNSTADSNGGAGGPGGAGGAGGAGILLTGTTGRTYNNSAVGGTGGTGGKGGAGSDGGQTGGNHGTPGSPGAPGGGGPLLSSSGGYCRIYRMA